MNYENFQPEIFDGSRPGTPDPHPAQPPAPPAPAPGLTNEQVFALMVSLSEAVTRQLAGNQSRPKPPRFPDVDRFAGDRSETATFLLRLKVFFDGQAETYDTDSKRISYIFQRLDGAALRWARPIFEIDSTDHLLLRSDMDCFLKAFKQLFEDRYRKSRATQSLLDLKQGSRSATDYWTEFVQLLAESSIDAVSAREIFYKGLAPELKRRLEDKAYSEDLTEFANQVCELEFRINSNRRFAPLAAPSPVSSSPSSTFGLAPMQIDAVHRGTSREDAIRRLPKEEQRRICLAEGRCFYCKQLGHVLRDCPIKPNKQAPSVGASSSYLTSFELAAKETVVLSDTALMPTGGSDVSSTIPPKASIELAALPSAPILCSQPQYSTTVESCEASLPEAPLEGSTIVLSSIGKAGQVPLFSGCIQIGNQVVRSSRLMVDSGAAGFAYMSEAFCTAHGFQRVAKRHPVLVQTADGAPLGTGRIDSEVTHVRLSLAGHSEILPSLDILPCPHADVLLGAGWLATHNPDIDWDQRHISFSRCPCPTSPFQEASVSEIYDSLWHEDVRAVAAITISTGDLQTPGRLDSLLEQYASIFTEDDLPDLPPRRPGVDMAIDLLPGAQAPWGPLYSLSRTEEEALLKYIKQALDKGLIRPSSSAAGAPVLFVKKADGSLRFCVDYRALNAVTKTNRTALPLIKDMLGRLKGAKVFSKLDLKSAFNLLRIREGDEHLTAFRTKYGHYEYNVVPFGFKNAPGTFQGFMNHIFADVLDRGVLAYIDDVLVYAETQEEHDRLLELVLSRLKQHGLAANPAKCVFSVGSVEFLGHVVEADGIRMSPARVKAITEWQTPISLKQLQSFLGVTNFYRSFIPHYSDLAVPLTALTKQNAPFVWSPACAESFMRLKSAVASDQVLGQPDQDAAFFLECDASDFALGAVLHQKDPVTQVLRPIGFYSHKFTPAELNYTIYDKELFAVLSSLQNWRHLLIGTDLPVTIYTDHQNLSYFKTRRLLNRRQARWSEQLSDFNMVLVPRAGTLQVVSDALSRANWLARQPDDPQPNRQVLLDERLFVTAIALPRPLFISSIVPFVNSDSEVSASDSDFDINDYASDLETDNPSSSSSDDATTDSSDDEEDGEEASDVLLPLLISYLNGRRLPLVLSARCEQDVKRRSRFFTLKDGHLHRKLSRQGHFYEAPYVVPSTRQALLARYHVTLGHLAAASLMPLLEVRFWWPGMRMDIKSFIAHCIQCQLASRSPPARHPLHPHDPVGLPFTKWGVDFIQDLPPSASGKRQIITAIDYATKLPIAVAVASRDARTVATFIYEQITCRFGAPVEIVTDRASCFMANVLQEYLAILGTRHLPSTPYHPQTNGAVERMHAPLVSILAKLCQGDWTEWDIFLPQAIFALSARQHSATGHSPFSLAHGLEPRLPSDSLPPADTVLAPTAVVPFERSAISTRILEQLGQDRAAALFRLQAQATRMKARYDGMDEVTGLSLSPGDLVKMLHPQATKLDLRWIGPYYVIAAELNGSCFLMKPDGQRLDHPVSTDRLAPFLSDDVNLFYSGNSALSPSVSPAPDAQP